MSFKFMKLEWLSEPGSQKKLVNSTSESNVYCIIHYKYKRAWTNIAKNNIEEFIKTNIGLHEVIPARFIRKIYFDVEVYNRECLENIIRIIMTLLPDAILNISGSVQDFSKYPHLYKDDPEKRIKYSYHIIVNNYHFENHSDQEGLKRFCEINKNEGFDPNVYGTTQLMKCINQSKVVNNKQWAPFVQSYISGSSSLTDHLITNFFDENSINAKPIFDKFRKNIIVNPRANPNNIRQVPLNIFKDINNVKGLELIYLFPDDIDHGIRYKVAMYCAKKNISFEEFWKWVSRYNVNQNKWTRDYDYISKTYVGEKNWITDGIILKHLEFYYPNIRKTYYQRIYSDFSKIVPTKDIKELYLKSDNLETSKKFIYLITHMGSNKTGSVIDYVKKTKSNCVFFACKKALAINVGQRGEDFFVKYSDIKKLKQIAKINNIKTTDKTLKRDILPTIDRLIITPHSCHYIKDKVYDIVIIDEIEVFLSSWTNPEIYQYDTSLGRVDNYEQNWNTIKNLIKSAKKVILMDALPSRNTFRYLQRFGINESEIEVIGSSVRPEPVPILRIKDSATGNEVNNFIDLLFKNIASGRKCFIFWPHKKPKVIKSYKNLNCDELDKTIKNYAMERGLNLKSYVYYSNSPDIDTLENVNKNWDSVDYIITNQTITVGVNCSVRFDDIFIADINYVPMREIVQCTKRIRNINGRVYYMKLPGTTVNDFVDLVRDYSEDIRETVYDVINEWRGRSGENLIETYIKAGYKWIVDENEFTNLEEITDEYIGPDNNYNWSAITVYESDSEIKQLQEKIVLGIANIYDYLTFEKIRFCKSFSRDWRLILDNSLASYLWNHRSFVYKYTNMPDWLKIINENAMSGKWELDRDNRQRIREFIVNRIGDESGSTKSLIMKCLNTYFRKSIVVCEKDGRRYNYIYDQPTIDIIDDIKRLSQEVSFREL